MGRSQWTHGHDMSRPPVNTLSLAGKSICYLNSGYSVKRSIDDESTVSHTAFQITPLSHCGFQVCHGRDQGVGRNSQALGKDGRGRGR